MDHFKKTSVAVVLTLLIVALCCVWGYTRVNTGPASVIEDDDHQRAGESSLNYYLSWTDDRAKLFSLDATDYLARQNQVLDHTYDGLLAVTTVNRLYNQDIEDAAAARFDQLDLGSRDILLYIDRDSQSWYVTYGAEIRAYVEQNEGLMALFHGCLDGELFADEVDPDSDDYDPDQPLPTYGRCLMALAGNVGLWYENTLSPIGGSSAQYDGKAPDLNLSTILSAILLTLLVNIWWILLLFLALEFTDQFRLQRYLLRFPPDTTPATPFRPLLFWHVSGSRWYERMSARFVEEHTDADDEEEEEPEPRRASGKKQNANTSGEGYANASQEGQGYYEEAPYDDYVGPGYVGDPNFGPRPEHKDPLTQTSDFLNSVSDQLRRFFNKL